MRTLVARQPEFDLVGTLPHELDGLLVLPTENHRKELVLNALRLGGGGGLWYASVTRPALATSRWSANHRTPTARDTWARSLACGGERTLLRTRRVAENWLLWTLVAPGERTHEAGRVALEREIADMYVTEQWLVFLGIVEREPRHYAYQIGVAPRRRPKSRVRWLDGETAGWPELLCAREVGGLLQLDLAIRNGPGGAPARIVRCEADLRTSEFVTRQQLEQTLAWPQLCASKTERRTLVCGIGSLDGKAGTGLLCFDLESAELSQRDFGFGRELGAPVFARPKHTTSLYVMLPVYDAVRDSTDCWVLDTAALAAAPCAIVSLDKVRATTGTHWLPARDLQSFDDALSTLTELCR